MRNSRGSVDKVAFLHQHSFLVALAINRGFSVLHAAGEHVNPVGILPVVVVCPYGAFVAGYEENAFDDCFAVIEELEYLAPLVHKLGLYLPDHFYCHNTITIFRKCKFYISCPFGSSIKYIGLAVNLFNAKCSRQFWHPSDQNRFAKKWLCLKGN